MTAAVVFVLVVAVQLAGNAVGASAGAGGISSASYPNTKADGTAPLRQWPSPSGIDPYPVVYGGSFTGRSVPASPDPFVSYRWRQGEYQPHALQVYYQRPTRVSGTQGAFGGMQTLTHPVSSPTNVTVFGAGSILMEFPQETASWLEFESPDLDLKLVNLTLATSEHLGLDYVQPGNVTSGVPTQHGKIFRLELNPLLYEGVRFATLSVSSVRTTFRITDLRLVCQVFPVNYEGSFNSSVPLLEQIWYTGAYTVRLNLLPTYIGAILVDRGDRFSWTGDAHVAQATALAAFSDTSYIRNVTAAMVDPVWHSPECNKILSYCLYWILSIVDYTKHTGDTSLALRFADVMNATLTNATLAQTPGNTPFLNFYGWDDRLGSGFEDAGLPESQRCYAMLTIRVAKEFAWLVASLPPKTAALGAVWQSWAEDRITRLREEGGPLWYKDFGLHASAEAINADFMTTEESNAVYNAHFHDDVNICSKSNFNQYWILQAVGRLAHTADAVVMLQRCWGNALSLGATTFWETFSPEWMRFTEPNAPIPSGNNGFTSFCHPWASGPTPWLSWTVAGISPATLGFKHVQIKPMLSGAVGLTRVSAQHPTPLGPVSVSFDLEAGIHSVTLPHGSSATVHIPHSNTTGIPEVDAQLAWSPSWSVRVLMDGLPLGTVPGVYADTNGPHLRVFGVPPGHHVFIVPDDACDRNPRLAWPSSVRNRQHIYRQVGDGALPPPPPSAYPQKALAPNRTVGGNWIGVFGSAGYSLAKYGAFNASIGTWPVWVKNISYAAEPTHAETLVWEVNTSDARALLPPSGEPQSRNATAWASKDTFNVDVNVTRSAPTCYELSVYQVDWDHRSRVEVVRLLTMDTFNLAAPDQKIEDFGGGLWTRYRITGGVGVRVRISRISGSGFSVVSGVFFDPCSSS